MPDKIHERRHREWSRWSEHWRWLLDSYEGGAVYRDAVYGKDSTGQPQYNLVRHKHEQPDPYDKAAQLDEAYPNLRVETLQAQGYLNDPEVKALRTKDPSLDTFELRRHRTPVPAFTRQAIESHLSRIFSREIARKVPASLKAWYLNVDGKGTTIDDYMRYTLAGLLMTYGQLDLLFDHPKAPEGVDPSTLSVAEANDLGLNDCVLSYILPENVLDWKLDTKGRYVEVLVKETLDTGEIQYRLWNALSWTLFDEDGDQIGQPFVHGFGRVPIVRIFDRKRPRHRNIGLPRYENIAEYQREYYNRDSELVLNDTLLSSPVLQGPADQVGNDGSIPVGPGYMLLKQKSSAGGTTTYEGYEYVDPPKGADQSLRQNKSDIRDEVDRQAQIARPAGSKDVAKGTVEQSGISKQLDRQDAHELLSEISATLRKCEQSIAEYALVVLGGVLEVDQLVKRVRIVYPTSFDLYSTSDASVIISDFQKLLSQSGNLPDVEGAMLQGYVRLAVPDRTDEVYDAFDRSIEEFLAAGGGLQKTLDRTLAAQPPADASGKATPAGKAGKKVSDPKSRLQPPGQTGRPKVKKAD